MRVGGEKQLVAGVVEAAAEPQGSKRRGVQLASWCGACSPGQGGEGPISVPLPPGVGPSL